MTATGASGGALSGALAHRSAGLREGPAVLFDVFSEVGGVALAVNPLDDRGAGFLGLLEMLL
jgi:hypothetical protein